MRDSNARGPKVWLAIASSALTGLVTFLASSCSSVGPARFGAPPEGTSSGDQRGLALAHIPFRVGRPETPRVRVAGDGRSFETTDGVPYVPLGVTYYRPGTGWAPRVWKEFNPDATREDFALMKGLGVNCVRVVLTYESFYSQPGELDAAGLAKFDQFLAIAEHAGIHVHPTGPDHWEGLPEWARGDRVADDEHLQALEKFWRLFAARYKDRSVIFAYDLLNEPEVGWDSPAMRVKWHRWLERKYPSSQALSSAHRQPGLTFASTPIPDGSNAAGDRALLDYQEFRESLADDWTARQAGAIRSVDREALVTTGLGQWSVPALLDSPKHYSGFRPSRQARFLDFVEMHFYPLEHGAYEYRDEESERRNLAYLESVLRETARTGKPVVLAGFGWYGGGHPRFDEGRHPAATEAQQARWCSQVIRSTEGLASGWLTWGLYDHPEATDASELSGLIAADGDLKAWGQEFKKLAPELKRGRFQPALPTDQPVLDWDAAVTSTGAGKAFREQYLRGYRGGP